MFLGVELLFHNSYYGNYIQSFEELPNYFTKWLCDFQSQLYEGPSFSSSSPTLITVHLFDCSHTSDFYLPFSNDHLSMC